MNIKRLWHFLRNDDSFLSWILNVVLAFIIVKFIIFPILGFILATTHPVVAVVSNSMHHQGNFDEWWKQQGAWYQNKGLNKSEAKNWDLKNGFNKGDIIVLRGSPPYNVGDVIVFKGRSKNPIIHRIVEIKNNQHLWYQTKGDNNPDSYSSIGEINIPEGNVVGKSIFKIPYLGWIKLWFTKLLEVIK